MPPAEDPTQAGQQRDELEAHAYRLLTAAIAHYQEANPATDRELDLASRIWNVAVLLIILRIITGRKDQNRLPDDFPRENFETIHDQTRTQALDFVRNTPADTPEAIERFIESASRTLATRTHAEASLAAVSPAEDSYTDDFLEDIPYLKMWISRGDSKVRTLHRRLHGVTAKPDEDFWRFPATGQSLAYPGDPRAPLSQTINCRCVIFPVPAVQQAEAEEAFRPADYDRAFDLAASAALTAGIWDPSLHPRGRDGRFIEIGGLIDFFRSYPETDSGGWRRGKVVDLAWTSRTGGTFDKPELIKDYWVKIDPQDSGDISDLEDKTNVVFSELTGGQITDLFGDPPGAPYYYRRVSEVQQAVEAKGRLDELQLPGTESGGHDRDWWDKEVGWLGQVDKAIDAGAFPPGQWIDIPVRLKTLENGVQIEPPSRAYRPREGAPVFIFEKKIDYSPDDRALTERMSDIIAENSIDENTVKSVYLTSGEFAGMGDPLAATYLSGQAYFHFEGKIPEETTIAHETGHSVMFQYQPDADPGDDWDVASDKDSERLRSFFQRMVEDIGEEDRMYLTDKGTTLGPAFIVEDPEAVPKVFEFDGTRKAYIEKVNSGDIKPVGEAAKLADIEWLGERRGYPPTTLPWRNDQSGISEYGASSRSEDFAEFWAEAWVESKYGKIGVSKLTGEDVFLADVWPNRADFALGMTEQRPVDAGEKPLVARAVSKLKTAYSRGARIWREDLHPRDRNGRFIEVGGFVDVSFKLKRPRRAKVMRITPRRNRPGNPEVAVQLENGRMEIFEAKRLTAVGSPKARLDADGVPLPAPDISPADLPDVVGTPESRIPIVSVPQAQRGPEIRAPGAGRHVQHRETQRMRAFVDEVRTNPNQVTEKDAAWWVKETGGKEIGQAKNLGKAFPEDTWVQIPIETETHGGYRLPAGTWGYRPKGGPVVLVEGDITPETEIEAQRIAAQAEAASPIQGAVHSIVLAKGPAPMDGADTAPYKVAASTREGSQTYWNGGVPDAQLVAHETGHSSAWYLQERQFVNFELQNKNIPKEYDGRGPSPGTFWMDASRKDSTHLKTADLEGVTWDEGLRHPPNISPAIETAEGDVAAVSEYGATSQAEDFGDFWMYAAYEREHGQLGTKDGVPVHLWDLYPHRSEAARGWMEFLGVSPESVPGSGEAAPDVEAADVGQLRSRVKTQYSFRREGAYEPRGTAYDRVPEPYAFDATSVEIGDSVQFSPTGSSSGDDVIEGRIVNVVDDAAGLTGIINYEIEVGDAKHTTTVVVPQAYLNPLDTPDWNMTQGEMFRKYGDVYGAVPTSELINRLRLMRMSGYLGDEMGVEAVESIRMILRSRGVLAAGWDSKLHPRDRHGKFIEVFGWVDWLGDALKGPQRGQVVGMSDRENGRSRGILVRLRGDGGVVDARPNQIEVAPEAKGRLDEWTSGQRTLYHGSRYRSDLIQKSGLLLPGQNGEKGPGVYMTPDPELARRSYASEWDDEIKDFVPRGDVFSTDFDLDSLNILDLTADESIFREAEQEARLQGDRAKVRDILKAQGYDGLVHFSPGEKVPEYVIFDSVSLTEAAEEPDRPYYSADIDLTPEQQESLRWLETEARKYDNFDDFERAYQEVKWGTYWHLTDNPDFEFDPEKGPRDMSSLAMGEVAKGALMVTSDPEFWDAGYNEEGDNVTRPWFAQLDFSDLAPNEYQQVNRGMGNEFFVHPDAAKKVKLVRVVPREEGLRLSDELTPPFGSEEQLREWWDGLDRDLPMIDLGFVDMNGTSLKLNSAVEVKQADGGWASGTLVALYPGTPPRGEVRLADGSKFAVPLDNVRDVAGATQAPSSEPPTIVRRSEDWWAKNAPHEGRHWVPSGEEWKPDIRLSEFADPDNQSYSDSWEEAFPPDTWARVPLEVQAQKNYRLPAGTLAYRPGNGPVIFFESDSENFAVLEQRARDISSTIKSNTFDNKTVRMVVVAARENPDDAYWREEYGNPDFRSAASTGGIYQIYWNGRVPAHSALVHETGHSVAHRLNKIGLQDLLNTTSDRTEAHDLGRAAQPGGMWDDAEAVDSELLVDLKARWTQALLDSGSVDQHTLDEWAKGSEGGEINRIREAYRVEISRGKIESEDDLLKFAAIRWEQDIVMRGLPPSFAPQIQYGDVKARPGVTKYGATASSEDWAEFWRMADVERAQGRLGTSVSPGQPEVHLWDIWPERTTAAREWLRRAGQNPDDLVPGPDLADRDKPSVEVPKPPSEPETDRPFEDVPSLPRIEDSRGHRLRVGDEVRLATSDEQMFTGGSVEKVVGFTESGHVRLEDRPGPATPQRLTFLASEDGPPGWDRLPIEVGDEIEYRTWFTPEGLDYQIEHWNRSKVVEIVNTDQGTKQVRVEWYNDEDFLTTGVLPDDVRHVSDSLPDELPETWWNEMEGETLDRITGSRSAFFQDRIFPPGKVTTIPVEVQIFDSRYRLPAGSQAWRNEDGGPTVIVPGGMTSTVRDAAKEAIAEAKSASIDDETVRVMVITPDAHPDSEQRGVAFRAAASTGGSIQTYWETDPQLGPNPQVVAHETGHSVAHQLNELRKTELREQGGRIEEPLPEGFGDIGLTISGAAPGRLWDVAADKDSKRLSVIRSRYAAKAREVWGENIFKMKKSAYKYKGPTPWIETIQDTYRKEVLGGNVRKKGIQAKLAGVSWGGASGGGAPTLYHEPTLVPKVSSFPNPGRAPGVTPYGATNTAEDWAEFWSLAQFELQYGDIGKSQANGEPIFLADIWPKRVAAAQEWLERAGVDPAGLIPGV